MVARSSCHSCDGFIIVNAIEVEEGYVCPECGRFYPDDSDYDPDWDFSMID